MCRAARSRLVGFLVVLSLLNMLLPGCESQRPTEGGTGTGVPYEGEALNTSTNQQGRVKISSDMIEPGYRVEYEFTVTDSVGKPISGIEVSYCEPHGKSLVYMHDPQGRYVPAMIYATPSEIDTEFGSGSALDPGPVLGDSQAIILIAIAAFIALAAITYAEVSFIIDAYRIQTFYITDVVDSDEDYILYCKTWEEIAELIKSRTSATLNLTSIVVSYITFGAGSMSQTAWGHAVEGIATASVEELRQHLLAQAIEEWGIAMSEIEDKKMAVKVYPFEEDEFAARFRNIWATYQIQRNNPICEQSGNKIEGRVVDATSGDPLEGTQVTISGKEERSATTDSDGDYAFTDLLSGTYGVAASRSGYISENREVVLSGSPVQVNFALSPELQEGDFRIVLTWGYCPRDLDSHLWVGDYYHVYFAHRGSESSPPYAYLDVDEVSGYGPETITITQLYEDCKYAVYNYSEDPDIKTSGAEVRIYSGSSHLGAYSIPTSGDGLWWYVFDLSGTGVITTRNYLTHNPPALLGPQDREAKVLKALAPPPNQSPSSTAAATQ